MPTIEPLIYPPGLDPSLLTTTMIAVSRSALSALGASVGATLDPSRGVLAGTLTDCDNKPAAGVVFDVEQADEQTSSYYFQNGLPSVGRTATDEGGTAGFVNVPAGLVTVTTKLERTNQRIGSRTLLVRPGTLTAFSLPPTPL
jgi:protocatechuate 3,4-dioxygenase beta subunit